MELARTQIKVLVNLNKLYQIWFFGLTEISTWTSLSNHTLHNTTSQCIRSTNNIPTYEWLESRHTILVHISTNAGLLRLPRKNPSYMDLFCTKFPQKWATSFLDYHGLISLFISNKSKMETKYKIPSKWPPSFLDQSRSLKELHSFRTIKG